ncbi:MAG: hypothetical protein WC792_01915 [Candidatus Micrarchaeia archaeon]|jgi:vacuolar-type H+-ATPase subunit E/Vma4
MGFEKLVREMAQSTSEEEERIREEGRREAAGIISEARREAEKIRKAALAQAEEAAGRERYALATAGLEAEKIVSDARQAIVARVLSDCRELAFDEITSGKNYPALFEALAKSATDAAGKGSKLYCSKNDSGLAKKLGYSPVQLECAGGALAVSSDGQLRADNTLEALFEENEESLRSRAMELMFGNVKKKRKG